MHIIYSAINEPYEQQAKLTPPVPVKYKADIAARFLAHQLICEKYREEIAAIQRYLPNWKPAFTWDV